MVKMKPVSQQPRQQNFIIQEALKCRASEPQTQSLWSSLTASHMEHMLTKVVQGLGAGGCSTSTGLRIASELVEHTRPGSYSSNKPPGGACIV